MNPVDPRRLLAAVVLSLASSSFAHAAGIDSSFGNQGLAVVTVGGASAQAGSAVFQPDGKLLVAGFTPGMAPRAGLEPPAPVATRNMLVARFNVDGSLDTSFGNGGLVQIDFAGRDDRAESVALQADGRILVSGRAETSAGNFDIALARLTAAGALDTSFDGDGKATFDFGRGDEAAASVLVAADGSILFAGTSATPASTSNPNGFPASMVAGRLSTAGAPDASYGTSGSGRVSVTGSGGDRVVSATLQADGRLVLAGQTVGSSGPGQPGVPVATTLRINANGTLDTSFGLNGFATLTRDSNTAASIAATAQQLPAGGYLVTGLRVQNTVGFPGTLRFAGLLARGFADTGLLDTTFGASGYAATNLAPGGDFFLNATREPGGKILVGGYGAEATPADARRNALVVRYDANGLLDTTFNGTGSASIPQSDGSSALSVSGLGAQLLRARDGRIVLVGTRGLPVSGTSELTAASQQIFVARLNSDPTFSTTDAAVSVPEAQNTLAVAVTRNGSTTGAVTLSYAIESVTASAADVALSSGTLTWLATDPPTKTINVALTPDGTDEPNETFTVTLSTPSEGSLADRRVTTVTIVDDDEPTPPAGGGAGGSSGGGGALGLGGLGALSIALLARRRRRLAPG